jgi:hypothetical protein
MKFYQRIYIELRILRRSGMYEKAKRFGRSEADARAYVSLHWPVTPLEREYEAELRSRQTRHSN